MKKYLLYCFTILYCFIVFCKVRVFRKVIFTRDPSQHIDRNDCICNLFGYIFQYRQITYPEEQLMVSISNYIIASVNNNDYIWFIRFKLFLLRVRPFPRRPCHPHFMYQWADNLMVTSTKV
jgi:hypothetical protein